MRFHFIPLILSLLVSGHVLAREPIAVLENKNKELRADLSAPGARQALSEVTRVLHDAREELNAAIANGSLNELRREIGAGLDPSQSRNWRIFSTAVCKRQVAAVRLLVRSASEAEKLATGPGKPWDCVAESNDPGLARAVLEAGPPRDWDPEMVKRVIRKRAISLFELSPLNAISGAVELGHPELARQMLDASERPEKNLESLVQMAMAKPNAALVEDLLKLDGEGFLLTPSMKTSLLEGTVSFGNVEIVANLLEAGARPTREAVERAASRDRSEVLRALVAGGVDPWLAMRVALDKEAIDSLRVLAQDTLYTPRGIWSEEVGPEQLARDLLAGGLAGDYQGLLAADGRLNLEARDRQGATVLMLAAKAGTLQLVKFHLLAGSDPNAQDHQRQTALFIAAHKHDIPVMTALRQAGADELRAKNGRSPAEEFWASLRMEPYASLDPKGKSLTFALPSSFFTPCHPITDSTSGPRLACHGEFDMKIEFALRRTPARGWIQQILSLTRAGVQEGVQQEEVPGTPWSCSLTGSRGGYELTITASGPEILAPELRQLPMMTWSSLKVPETGLSRKLVRALVGLFGVAILVVLLSLLWYRRRIS